jgi:hypothetical protein
MCGYLLFTLAQLGYNIAIGVIWAQNKGCVSESVL